MSRPIYPALVGEGARLGRSKTGDNQQRDDQRHEAGSSHEGTSRLMIEITNVTWDGNAPARPPAGRPQCTNVANGTKRRLRNVRFSNRPFRVKHFQTNHHSTVHVARPLAPLLRIRTTAPVWGL